jgi:hypothetical protein
MWLLWARHVALPGGKKWAAVVRAFACTSFGYGLMGLMGDFRKSELDR